MKDLFNEVFFVALKTTFRKHTTMFQRNKKSFTLIEMLIVIVIIGILAAALVPRLQSVQSRARDTKRKTDLRTIYNANEIYFLDNGDYSPDIINPGNYYSRSTIPSTRFLPQFTGILSNVPIDPINVAGETGVPRGTGGYLYFYINLVTQNGKRTYDLVSQLENKLDPDRAEIAGRKNQDGYTRSTVAPAGRYVYDLSPNVVNQ